MKGQWIRLLDVFFIGPYLIYSGQKLTQTDKTILQAIGIATIIYNGLNYIKYEKAKKLENHVLRNSNRP